MRRRILFRLLFLIACSSMVMIYTSTTEQRTTIYTPHTTPNYGLIRKHFFNSTSCHNSPGNKNSTGENTTKSSLESSCFQPNNIPRSKNYRLLDSDERLDLYCKQCALVFSSGHLTGSNMGRDIDNTQCVIRLNTATVRGHINDVGMRTTVRVIGHRNVERGLLSMNPAANEILKSSKTRPEIIYVPWLFEQSINRTTNNVYVKARRYSKLFPKVKFYFQSDDMISEMEEMYTNETGLNRREPKSQVGYHYFESHKDRLRECRYTNTSESMIKGGHKFMTEKKLYAKWAHKRDIRFRAPIWPMGAFNTSDKFESPYLDIYRQAKENGTFDSYTLKKPEPVVAVNKSKPLSSTKVKRPLLRKFHVARRHLRLGQVKKKKGINFIEA